MGRGDIVKATLKTALAVGQSTKKPKLGYNMRQALRAAQKLPTGTWMPYTRDRVTIETITRLEALGLVATRGNEFQVTNDGWEFKVKPEPALSTKGSKGSKGSKGGKKP